MLELSTVTFDNQPQNTILHSASERTPIVRGPVFEYQRALLQSETIKAERLDVCAHCRVVAASERGTAWHWRRHIQSIEARLYMIVRLLLRESVVIEAALSTFFGRSLDSEQFSLRRRQMD